MTIITIFSYLKKISLIDTRVSHTRTHKASTHAYSLSSTGVILVGSRITSILNTGNINIIASTQIEFVLTD